jgi:hypothetical protein
VASTEAIASHGTLVKLGDGAEPEVFTTVAEVKDITLPDLGNEREDVTVQTTTGRHRVYKTMLQKDATVEFEVNFVPGDATHDSTTGLVALANSGDEANYQVVMPDEDQTTWTFAAVVDTFQPSGPVAGILTASVVLAVSGDIVESTGSGS